MRKSWILWVALVAVLDFSGVAIAALSTIGTASYGGSNYNLIYEDDQGLVWLDHTNGPIYSGGNSWPTQVNWASGLNNSGVLTYNINLGISVNWSGDWRLPETVDGPWVYGNDGTTTAGYNITSSEMGHLYYVSLGNLGPFDTSGNPQPGYGLQNTGPFNNLLDSHAYWSGTEYSLDHTTRGASILGAATRTPALSITTSSRQRFGPEKSPPCQCLLRFFSWFLV